MHNPDYQYLLLQAFGNRVQRHWSCAVGERQNNPCGRAVERALEDYRRWQELPHGKRTLTAFEDAALKETKP